MPTGDGTCQVIRAATIYEGKQHLQFFAGIAAETVGARGLCMHAQTIPPWRRGMAHIHDHHETGIYQISGASTAFFGERLQHRIDVRRGEFLYIPAGVPHMPVNFSTSQAAELILARTDPTEQESTILTPDLEMMLPAGLPPL